MPRGYKGPPEINMTVSIHIEYEGYYAYVIRKIEDESLYLTTLYDLDEIYRNRYGYYDHFIFEGGMPKDLKIYNYKNGRGTLVNELGNRATVSILLGSWKHQHAHGRRYSGPPPYFPYDK